MAVIDNPGQDTTVMRPDAVYFRGTASDSDGTISSHRWDLGDGNEASVGDPGAHTYAAVGTYMVTYEVTDDDGAVSEPAEVAVTVENSLPTAVIENPGQDTTALRPYAVDFQGTASDADGTIASHSWAFGDGNEASVEDPGPYAYAAVGTYTVTYQVMDDDGAVSEPAEVVVTVEEPTGVAPEPGPWLGGAEFGLLDFAVNGQGTAITNIDFIFDDWQCGGEARSERITSSNPAGWPITDGQFTIEATFPIELSMTVHGTFDANTAASGTWSGVSHGTTCSGGWQANRQPPEIVVFMDADFTATQGILGFKWLPGRLVTLEIDNGANGTIDFLRTTRAESDGVARFHEGGPPPPYTVAEGDLVRMYDAVNQLTYAVLYVTLEAVDAGADRVSGSAREGTLLVVGVDSPVPYIAGPELRVIAGASGAWSADFAGIFDILPNTGLWVTANCLAGGPGCDGNTLIVSQP
jgi:PKD repeat protein